MSDDRVQWLNIERSASNVGLQVWLNEQLFVSCGEALPRILSGSLRVVVATLSRLHGESSQAWRTVLPLLREPSPETFVTSPGGSLEAFIATWLTSEGTPTGDGDASFISAYEVVCESMLRHASDLGEAASPVSDAPIVRQSARQSVDFDAALDAMNRAVSGVSSGGFPQALEHHRTERVLEWESAASSAIVV